MQGQMSMILIMIAVGALLGLGFSEAWLLKMVIGETRWLAMVAGGFIGALWAIVIQQGRRIDILEERLESNQLDALSPASQPKVEKTPEKAAAPVRSPAPATDTTAPVSTAPQPRSRPSKPQKPSPLATWLRRWFSQGNVPVKIGVLVTFIGVAALLRYASEQGWLSMPIEMRLLAVALLALAGLFVGWRQRRQRRVFGLTIQGGSIGILLLTIFAGFRLYALLPASAAFALMVILVAGAGVLAIAQHSLSLAIVAMLAGFAAPLLVSTGDGSHIALFSWYAVLNLAVFGLAWARSWPILNRIGFAFTFIIATFWGVLAWSPDHYLSAQAFLLLFFLLYLLIPPLEARIAGGERKPSMDAVLVFGLPLFAVPLQIGLLGDDLLAIASAMLAGAVIYLLLAVLMFRRWQLPTLGRSYAVIAVGLATLAVPFAFSESTIVIIWALESAALVWFGCRQGRRLPRITGMGLYAMAAIIWLFSQALIWRPPDIVLLNPLFLGGLALAAAGLFSAWCYQRAGAVAWRVNLWAALGLLAWSINGISEVNLHLARDLQATTLVGFAAITTLLSATFYHHYRWSVAGLVPVLALTLCGLLAFEQGHHGLPIAGWGILVWTLVVVAALATDRWFGQADSAWRPWTLLGAHFAILAMLSVTATDLAGEYWLLGTGWQWLAGSLPILALAAWLLAGRPSPLQIGPDGGVLAPLTVTGPVTLVIVLGLIASLYAQGHPDPLPWAPLFNPLEITQVIGLLLLAVAARRKLLPLPAVALMVLITLSIMGLRSVHHLLLVPWDAASLLASNASQATLSVLWTVAGAMAWVIGSRHRQPVVWWSGAVLLGLVLVKLLLIDRQFLSAVAGILSFLAFGVLSMVVGYLAPAPPASTSEPEKST